MTKRSLSHGKSRDNVAEGIDNIIAKAKDPDSLVLPGEKGTVKGANKDAEKDRRTLRKVGAALLPLLDENEVVESDPEDTGPTDDDNLSGAESDTIGVVYVPRIKEEVFLKFCPVIVQPDPRRDEWVELFCQTCGTNVSPQTSEFIPGVYGFMKHFWEVHGKIMTYWEVVEACKISDVPAEVVDQIRETGKHTIEKILGEDTQ